MSLFDKIKGFFGFGVDDDEFVAPATPRVVNVPDVDSEGRVMVSSKMVHMIFDRVVEITNAAVPAYLSSGINPDKQKQYLYDALDGSIKDYIDAIEKVANEKSMAVWQKERDDLKREADNLRQRARDLDAKRSEMKEQNLSAERQKRALSDRVRDLEAANMQLEAEKEQLELEKHGLLNKLKVASVHGADAERLREELAAIQVAAPSQDLIDENKSLKQKVNDLNSTVDGLNSTVDALNKEIKQLSEACEAAKMKDEMGSAMLNDLQSRAAQSLKSAQDAQTKIDELEQELQLRDAQISDLKRDIEEKEARIAEDDEALSEIEDLVESMNTFEEIKNKYEERIQTLNEKVKEAKRENETLRTTIKNNLYAHAQQEKALNDRIEQLSGKSL